ncbi:YybH family protein [Streptomyces sp. NPDC020681]|uniref:YybH family protein n=1 Tax=Streptomyces sp. NPDC020681 TaxID=3365083 RepID=UPI00379EDB9E
MAGKSGAVVHAGGVEEHLAYYVRTFNAGDADAINQLYIEEAVSVWEPGKPLSGETRRANLAEFLKLRPELSAKIRESHVTSDTALLSVDWRMEVDGEGGTRESFGGLATDVLRRGADGNWRYAIDDPYGDPRNEIAG